MSWHTGKTLRFRDLKENICVFQEIADAVEQNLPPGACTLDHIEERQIHTICLFFFLKNSHKNKLQCIIFKLKKKT